MDTIHRRCAGLDVHKKTVVARVRRVGDDGTATALTRTFGTMTAELLGLADWPAEMGVTHAAMEATGVYWKPVWHLLEGRFELMLVDARHIKQVPGRKADVKDAEWIARPLQHGLLSPSFVPPRAICELRDLTRQRAVLVRERAHGANRVEKVLESANIKLSAVAGDVLGASGRAMIAALIAGREDPERLAGLARQRLRAKIPQLRLALHGRVTEHHRFPLRMLMEQVAHLGRQVGQYGDRIAEVMAREPAEAEAEAGPAPAAPGPAPAEAARRLATIPGVGERSAEAIVAEIGTDMGRFASAAHLASWAGVCPGNDVSAGKRRSGKTTRGSVWLRTTLVQVAWAASHTKGTAPAASYRRWAKRLSRKKALVALAHKILRRMYSPLKSGADYTERLPKGQAA